MPNAATVKTMCNQMLAKTDLKIGKRIGSPSAYGAVFELKGRQQSKKVVKVFLARTLKDGYKEVSISAKMGLEGISPRIYKAGIVGLHNGYHVLYMTMDKISGDLYSMKSKQPLFYERHKKHIKKQIKRLITKMHSMQFAHADLKDDNIGYLSRGNNKPPKMYVIDFGLSTLHNEALRTNKNLATAIVRAYREHNYSYKDVIEMNALPSIQRRFLEELHANLKLKRSKAAVSIAKMYKQTKNKNFKNLLINVNGAGPMRYRIADEHWIVFNAKDLMPASNKPSGTAITQQRKYTTFN